MTEKKKAIKKVVKKEKAAAKPEKQADAPKAETKATARYLFAIGRRKTAVARIKFTSDGKGLLTVNGRQFTDYFPTETLQKAVSDPLTLLGQEKVVDIAALVSGGGIRSQAGAMALGIARALVMRDPASKTVLKKHGLTTRDARKKERKKPGLKRARRAPQWQKR